jgi:hypothetical protein
MSNTEKPTEQNDLSLNTENTSEDYTQARLVPDNGNPEQTDPSSKSENTSDDHAQKLSGPVKTPASKNALVHGLYASDVLLPGNQRESSKRFFGNCKKNGWLSVDKRWKQSCRSPGLIFLKHRLMRSTQIVFRSDPLEVEKAGAKSWREIALLMQKHAIDQELFEQDIRAASQALANCTPYAIQ